ncbi:FIG01002288: hypothetical protein [hydrothermal vent metagenome]|uniref:Dienelactone hydrolase domain-containing protein n=1 Tax=hydrothermal vent metagenome TaxID=652676 RepID=A0A3B0RXG3_9ZZZZ
MTSQTDMLDDFTRREITLNQITKTVLVAGFGPGVVVLAEKPEVSLHVVRFARWMKDAGFRVYLPSLFGCDDRENVLQHACVSAEFRALVADKTSPVTRWLRALAQLAHEECDGPGVGTIGMCFAGNFALGMVLEPSMLALDLGQPDALKSPLENLDLLAYRFADDTFCQAQRFAAYREAQEERFVGQDLPDAATNNETPAFTKTFIATHLIDAMNQPTMTARDEIIAFFKQGL